MQISDFFTDRENDILEALRPISERRMEVGDQYGKRGMVNVFRNVASLNLVQMVEQSKLKQVRGLFVGRDIYFWDSFYATHKQVADALEADYHLENRIHVWIDSYGGVCFETLDRPLGDFPEIPAMQRLLASPNILFDGGSDGYLTGPEMMELITA